MRPISSQQYLLFSWQMVSVSQHAAHFWSGRNILCLWGRTVAYRHFSYPLHMIAVIFEVWPGVNQQATYFELAAQLRSELDSMDGFISIERFQSLTTPSKYLSLSFWRDEAAVRAWRNREAHRAAPSRKAERACWPTTACA